MNSGSLDQLLERVERELVSEVPRLVTKLNPPAPVYCLFLWYWDLSVDEYAPLVAAATEQLREACLGGANDDRLGDPPEWCVWRPQQTIDEPFPGYPLPTAVCDFVAADANSCYDMLTQGEVDLAEEEEILLPFRRMMCRVARQLNEVNWSERLQVSDDFVVVATDYIGYWLDVDFEDSLGRERLAALQRSGNLPKWEAE